MVRLSGTVAKGRVEFILAEAVVHWLQVVAGVTNSAIVVIGQDHLFKAVTYPLGSEVHLADGGGLIAARAQVRRQGGLSTHHHGGLFIVSHAVGEHLLACHDTHARRYAERAIGVGARELHALVAQ